MNSKITIIYVVITVAFVGLAIFLFAPKPAQTPVSTPPISTTVTTTPSNTPPPATTPKPSQTPVSSPTTPAPAQKPPPSAPAQTTLPPAPAAGGLGGHGNGGRPSTRPILSISGNSFVVEVDGARYTIQVKSSTAIVNSAGQYIPFSALKVGDAVVPIVDNFADPNRAATWIKDYSI